jgi:hypothetical protein
MKSLKFVKLNLSDTDILTRLEMKSVTGGYSCWCYHNDHESPDSDGCETTCDNIDSIDDCCGGGYDGMNCS